MIYQKSFSLKFILEQLRRFWWVSTLYFICLFFALPFRILVKANEWSISLQKVIETSQSTKVPLEYIFKIDLFNYTWGAECLAFVIVPVFITALLFSYLNKKTAIDTIHSLPIKREKLYFLNVLSGVLLYTLPIILIALIIAVIVSVLGFWAFISVSAFFIWIATSLIFLSFFYVFSILMAIFTGNVPAMVALTYFFSVLPAGIYILINLTLSSWFYGFNNSSILSQNFITYSSPLVRCFMLLRNGYKTLNVLECITYLILIAAILFLGCLLYKKRKSESATNVLAFKISEPFVKYIIIFCGTILFGTLLFAFNSENNVIILILGYLIGGALFYMIVQSIIYKDIRAIKKDLKGLSVYLIVSIIVSISLLFDFFGYQKYVPLAKEVKSIQFNTVVRSFSEYSSKESIEILTSLHKEVLSEKFNESYNPLKYRTQTHNSADQRIYQSYYGTSPIKYQLINGATVERSYDYSYDLLLKYLPKLFTTNEGKRNTSIIFNNEFILPEKMQITAAYDNSILTNQNPDQIEYILSALKKDILDDPSPIEFKNTDISLGKIDFDKVIKDKDKNIYQSSFSIYIKNYYKNTINVLNSMGIRLRPLIASNISSMEINVINIPSGYKFDTTNTDTKTKSSAYLISKPLIITDPVLISQVFSKMKEQNNENFRSILNNILNIKVILKNSSGSDGVYTINNNEIPEFILEYYNLK